MPRLEAHPKLFHWLRNTGLADGNSKTSKKISKRTSLPSVKEKMPFVWDEIVSRDLDRFADDLRIPSPRPPTRRTSASSSTTTSPCLTLSHYSSKRHLHPKDDNIYV